jgi:hypothetical protein
VGGSVVVVVVADLFITMIVTEFTVTTAIGPHCGDL